MNTIVHNLAIIGSGPAGLTAAIYAARAALQPIVFEGKTPGGQLMSTTLVENWPGTKTIMGPQLMIDMRTQAQALGATLSSHTVKKISAKNRPFELILDDDTVIQARTIIVATGATPRRLNCAGEEKYWGRGVTTCTVCDGALYKDKPVVIVGGGDTAMESASFMLNFTKDITIVQIMPTLTASAAMQERVLKNPNIKIIYNSSVQEIRGDKDQVTSVIIADAKTKKPTGELNVNAVFLAVGLDPNTQPFEGVLELTSNKYLKLTDHTKTSVPGIFGAGDVADPIYRQAVTSAGIGCMAALDAERFLKEHA